MLLTIAVLVLLGILLMILETFIPGWVAGIVGGLCVLAAVALVVVADDFSGWPAWGRTALACGIVALTVVSLLLWMRYFGIRVWHRTFTLDTSIPTEEPSEKLPLGTEGVAVSELRPLGRVDFSGARREVRCEDGFAPEGARVRVTGMEPGNLLVRLIDVPPFR